MSQELFSQENVDWLNEVVAGEQQVAEHLVPVVTKLKTAQQSLQVANQKKQQGIQVVQQADLEMAQLNGAINSLAELLIENKPHAPKLKRVDEKTKASK